MGGYCCTPKTCKELNTECGFVYDEGCNWPMDCGACGEHQLCDKGHCLDQPYCGNGNCEPNEGCDTCATDCGCGNGQVCYKNACCTPGTCEKIGLECGISDDGCGGSLDCGKCLTGPCTPDYLCIDPWVDPVTGYEWQVVPSRNVLHWKDAVNYCKALGNGWHLPTISELRTLIRGCQPTQTGGSCGVTDECRDEVCWSDSCLGCKPLTGYSYGVQDLTWHGGFYWSSSSWNDIHDPAWSWFVYFGTARIRRRHQNTELLGARCVRVGL